MRRKTGNKAELCETTEVVLMSAQIYDFDKIIERRGTRCMKWDELDTYYGETDVLPLWVADMDFETAPEIVEALHRRIDHKIFGYVHSSNDLNQEAVNWTLRRYGHEVDPSQLAFSPGVIPSMSLLIRDFVSSEEMILIQPPVYGSFARSIVNNGRTLLTSPLKELDGEYSIDFDDFELKASNPRLKWFILCNPHNPVGRVWTRPELERLSKICLKHELRVISDEIWRDLVFKGHRHIPFASLSKQVEDITITLFSTTKTFNLGGIQASFAHIPRQEELERFRAALNLVDSNRYSPFSLTATEAAFTQGEPWLDALVQYLQGNMDYISNFIYERLHGVRFVKPEATYLAWLDFRELGLDQNELMGLLQAKGRLALNDGFWFGREGLGFARMNAACPRSTLEYAMGRIEKALEG